MQKIILFGISAILISMKIASCDTPKKGEISIGKDVKGENKNQNKINSNKMINSPFGQDRYSVSSSGLSLENPIEVDLDKKIIQVTKRYSRSTEIERKELRDSLTQEDIYTIFSFCERATVFGLRKQNENIEFGLSALSMINAEEYDFRDILFSIAFVNHGIEKLNFDTDDLYRKAIEISNPKMKELLSSFKNREPRDKAIEQMAGYTEYQYENGIGFIKYGYNRFGYKYNPNTDLPRIAFAINKEIGKDKYYASRDVSVAEMLPFIWIKGNDEVAIKGLLNQTTGIVRLRANLRKEFTENWMSQMFLLHLVEFDNEVNANQFRKLLSPENEDKFAKIFGVVGDIFYVLVSKSTKLGVDNYETYESIQRFRNIIEKEIKKKNSH